MAVIFNRNLNKKSNTPTLQTVGTATPAGESPTGTPTANSMANNLAQQQQGSGRFTNLQKYIQANKAGGQKIAQQVGSGFQKQYDKEATQAKDYYTNLRTSIDQAEDVVGQGGTGQGFQKDLKGIGEQIGGQEIGAIDSDAFKTWQNKIETNKQGLMRDHQTGFSSQIQDPAKQQEYLEKYNNLKNQAHPMDFGPNSAHNASIYRQKEAIAALQAEYGIVVPQPVAPLQTIEIVRPNPSLVRKTFTPEEIEAQRQEQYKQYQQEMLANRGQADLSGIEAFTSDEKKFRDFQNLQAGRAVNENLLGLQQQRALTEAGQAADLARQTQAGLGNEAGRFEMLRKTFGNAPGYTTGQQRLDQVLFGQGGGLTGLQGNVTQKARSAVEQGNLAARAGQDVGRIAQAEKGLITGINDQAKTNEQAYMNMLASYADPLQQQRTADFKDLNRAVESFSGENQNQYLPGFTADQMSRLGLTDKNQGVYNVFRGPGGVTTADDIAKKGQNIRMDSNVTKAQDVALDPDVARYKALANIIGKNFNPQITQASQIGDSWMANTGGVDAPDAGLKERLAAAQATFEGLASPTQETRSGGAGATRYGYNRGSYQDLIDKGRAGLQTGQVGVAQWGGGFQGKYNPTLALQIANDQMMQNFQNFLNQENYNRTLGGRRETFLDTEAAAKQAALGITPAIQPGEVTGTDPSLYPNTSNLLKGS